MFDSFHIDKEILPFPDWAEERIPTITDYQTKCLDCKLKNYYLFNNTVWIRHVNTGGIIPAIINKTIIVYGHFPELFDWDHDWFNFELKIVKGIVESIKFLSNELI